MNKNYNTNSRIEPAFHPTQGYCEFTQQMFFFLQSYFYTSAVQARSLHAFTWLWKQHWNCEHLCLKQQKGNNNIWILISRLIVHTGLFPIWVHSVIRTTTVSDFVSLNSLLTTGERNRNSDLKYMENIILNVLIIPDVSDFAKKWTKCLAKFKGSWELQTGQQARINPASMIKTKVRRQIYENYFVQVRTAILSHLPFL